MVQTGLSTAKHASRRRAAVVGVMVMVLRCLLLAGGFWEVVCAAAHLSEEPILAGQHICLSPYFTSKRRGGTGGGAGRMERTTKSFQTNLIGPAGVTYTTVATASAPNAEGADGGRFPPFSARRPTGIAGEIVDQKWRGAAFRVLGGEKTTEIRLSIVLSLIRLLIHFERL
jgi:hypothetical protein